MSPTGRGNARSESVAFIAEDSPVGPLFCWPFADLIHKAFCIKGFPTGPCFGVAGPDGKPF